MSGKFTPAFLIIGKGYEVNDFSFRLKDGQSIKVIAGTINGKEFTGDHTKLTVLT